MVKEFQKNLVDAISGKKVKSVAALLESMQCNADTKAAAKAQKKTNNGICSSDTKLASPDAASKNGSNNSRGDDTASKNAGTCNDTGDDLTSSVVGVDGGYGSYGDEDDADPPASHGERGGMIGATES